MTADEIRALPPQALRAWLAELRTLAGRVAGVHGGADRAGGDSARDDLPAAELVEFLRLRGVYLSVHAREAGYTCEAWALTKGRNIPSWYSRLNNEDFLSPAAAEAICRQALYCVTAGKGE